MLFTTTTVVYNHLRRQMGLVLQSMNTLTCQ